MDLWTDPPAAKEPPEATELPTHIAHVANPTPPLGPNNHHTHPPYAEMITAAVTALKEKNGSSRQAIAKYIEKTYTNLPATHSALLTHHLKRLKNNGQLLMVKHSYTIPRSVPLPSATTDSGTVTVVGNDYSNVSPNSGPKKRGVGRPPKPKAEGPRLNRAVLGPEPVTGFLGLPDEPLPTPVPVKRGRGRPPKAKKSGLSGPELGGPVMEAKKGRGRPPKPKLLSVLMGQGGVPKRRPGRPPKTVHIGSVPEKVGSVIKTPGRPRGRPAKKSVSDITASSGGYGGASVVSGNGMLPGKRRGRPAKKNAVAAGGIEGGAVAAAGYGMLPGKRRGRPVKNTFSASAPQKSSVVKKLRKFAGKPLGRPKKNALNITGSEAATSPAHEDLKNKLYYFQSRIKQAVSIVKPYLNDTAMSALGALQELEELATMDLSASINVPVQVQGEELVLPN